MINYITNGPFDYSKKIVKRSLSFLNQKLSKLSYGEFISIDTETNGLDPITNEVLLLGLEFENGQQILIDTTTVDKIELVSILDYWFKASNLIMVAHNLKFDYTMLKQRLGWSIPVGQLYDTMVAEQRLFQGYDRKDKKVNINAVRLSRLNLTQEDEIDKEQRLSFVGRDFESFIATEEELMYLSSDLSDLVPILKEQFKDLENQGILNFILDYEMPLQGIIGDCELVGYRVDEDKWRHITRDNENLYKEVKKELEEFVLKTYKLDFSQINKPNYERKIQLNRRIQTIEERIQSGLEDIKKCEDTNNKTNTKKYQNLKISYKKNTELLEILKKELSELETIVLDINWASGTQVLDFLELIGMTQQKGLLPLAKDKKTKKLKPSISDPARVDWFAKYSKEAYPEYHYIMSMIDKMNIIAHAISSFGEEWINRSINGRIYTNFKTAATATGRFASGGGKNLPVKINIQQIPGRAKPEDKLYNDTFRDCFIVDKGRKLSISDWSGAELTIMIGLSLDEKLKQISEDPHSHLAQTVWRAIYAHRAKKETDPELKAEYGFKAHNLVISKKENKHLRDQFKGLTFGTIYGMFESKAATTLGVPKEEGRIIIETIKKEIPDIFRVVEESTIDAFSQGYVICHPVIGTRRWFTKVLEHIELLEMESPDFSKLDKRTKAKIVERSIRDENFMASVDISSQSKNYKIQGLQAEMLKRAVVELYYWSKIYNIDIRLLAVVHDEFHYDFPEYYSTWVGEEIVEKLCTAANAYLPVWFHTMKSDYMVGDFWMK